MTSAISDMSAPLTHSDPYWAALTRTRPCLAPDPVGPSTQRVYIILTTVAYYGLLPFLTAYWVVYWLVDPAFPTWTYSRMTANRRAQLWSNLNAFYLPTLDDETARWDAVYSGYFGNGDTSSAYSNARAVGEIEIETVKLYPVGEKLQRGVGAGEWVKQEVVPGFWLSPSRASESRGTGDNVAEKGEKVVLHLHGGGYLMGYPFWNKLALQVAQHLQVRVSSVNYRKPLLPHTAFPAPLLDALSGYLHLVNDLHFDPRDITILGVSAGGHLTMMLSRFIDNLGLPHPGSLALVGPWLDFEMIQDSYDRHKPYDHLTTGLLDMAVRASTRWYDPRIRQDLYFSPVRATSEDWKYLVSGNVGVYINVGTKERFFDEVEHTAGKMNEAGVSVNVTHDVDGDHLSVLSDGRVGGLLRDLQDMRGT